jgi:hypothetical protein
LVAGALVALAVVAVGSGCASSGRPGGGPDEEVIFPPGPGQVMVAFRHSGGFVPPGWTFIDAPRVVVYSDGRAVADASRVLTLSPVEVAELTRQLRRDLRGLEATVTSRQGDTVADAPSTVLQVRTASGEVQSVSAYALGIVEGYPRPLVQARERLESLAKRISTDGTVYTGERVRLVAEERPEGSNAAAGWPATLAVPPENMAGVRVADVEAAAAVAVVGSVPPVYDLSGPWTVLRLPDGSLVGVAWRYLLPDE